MTRAPTSAFQKPSTWKPIASGATWSAIQAGQQQHQRVDHQQESPIVRMMKGIDRSLTTGSTATETRPRIATPPAAAGPSPAPRSRTARPAREPDAVEQPGRDRERDGVGQQPGEDSGHEQSLATRWPRPSVAWGRRSPQPPSPQPRPNVPAIPAYVPGKPPTPRQGLTSYKLSSNENPYPPLPGVVEAASGGGRADEPLPRHGGGGVVRRAGRAVRRPVANLSTATGSVALIYQILQAFCDPGDEVVYAWRSFEAYPIAVTAAAAASVAVPVRRR